MLREHPIGQEVSHARMEEILLPLRQWTGASAEYSHQVKELVEMDRRFRAVESLYAATYSGVVNLEKKIASHNEACQRQGCHK